MQLKHGTPSDCIGSVHQDRDCHGAQQLSATVEQPKWFCSAVPGQWGLAHSSGILGSAFGGQKR